MHPTITQFTNGYCYLYFIDNPVVQSRAADVLGHNPKLSEVARVLTELNVDIFQKKPFYVTRVARKWIHVSQTGGAGSKYYNDHSLHDLKLLYGNSCAIGGYNTIIGTKVIVNPPRFTTLIDLLIKLILISVLIYIENYIEDQTSYHAYFKEFIDLLPMWLRAIGMLFYAIYQTITSILTINVLIIIIVTVVVVRLSYMYIFRVKSRTNYDTVPVTKRVSSLLRWFSVREEFGAPQPAHMQLEYIYHGQDCHPDVYVVSATPEIVRNAPENILGLIDNTGINSDVYYNVGDNYIVKERYMVFTSKHLKQAVQIDKSIQGSLFTRLDNEAMTAGVELTPGGKLNSLHPINAAVRAMHKEAIKRAIGAGKRVLVVGSNPASWPRDGYVHNIANVDIKDGARKHAALNFCNNMRANYTEVEMLFGRLNEVRGKYDVIVCVDSVYDIPPEDLFFHAFRLCATELYITTFSNLSLYEDTVGVLHDSKMRFVKYDNVTKDDNGKPVIKKLVDMWHMNERSTSYVHDSAILNKYMILRKVRLSDNYCYVIEPVVESSEVVTLKCSLVEDVDVTGKVHLYNTWADRVMLFAAFNFKPLVKFMFKQKTNVHFIPTDIMDKVVGSCYSQKDPAGPTSWDVVKTLYADWEKKQFLPSVDDYARSVIESQELMSSLVGYTSLLKLVGSEYKMAEGLMDATSSGLFSMVKLVTGINSHPASQHELMKNQMIMKYCPEREADPLTIDLRKLLRDYIIRDEVKEEESDEPSIERISQSMGNVGTQLNAVIDHTLIVVPVGSGMKTVCRVINNRHRLTNTDALLRDQRINRGTSMDLGITAFRDVLARLRYENNNNDNNNDNNIGVYASNNDLNFEENLERNASDNRGSSSSISIGNVDDIKIADPVGEGVRGVNTHSGARVVITHINPGSVAPPGYEVIRTATDPNLLRGYSDRRGYVCTMDRARRIVGSETRYFHDIVVERLNHYYGDGDPQYEVADVIARCNFSALNDISSSSTGGQVLNYFSPNSRAGEPIALTESPLGDFRPSFSARYRLSDNNNNNNNNINNNDNNNNDSDNNSNLRNAINVQRINMMDNFISQKCGVLLDSKHRIEERAVERSRLGCNTNDMSFNVLKNFSGKAYVDHTMGKLYSSVQGTLFEAVYINPHIVCKYLKKNNIPQDTAANSMLTTLPIVLIKNECFMYNAVKTEPSVAKIYVVIQNGKFYRLVPHSTDLLTVLTTSDMMCFDTLTVKQFDVAATFKYRSAPEGYCLYKLLNVDYETLIPLVNNERERACSPNGIIRAGERHSFILFNKDVAYYSRAAANDAGVCKYIYCIDTHVYEMTPADGKKLMSVCSIMSLDNWTKHLNGDIPETVADLTQKYAALYNIDNIDRSFKKFNNIIKRVKEELDMLNLLPELNAFHKAIKETLIYNTQTEQILMHRLLLIFQKRNQIQYLRAISTACVYDRNKRKFIGAKPDKIYKYCFDGDDFLPTNYDKTRGYRIKTKRPLVLMCDEIEFLRSRMISDNIIPKIKDIWIYDFTSVDWKLIDGVAGCGKTTTIMHQHVPGNDLVGTTTKAGRDEIASMVNVNDDVKKTHYRTYDSCLMNPVPNVYTMFADEGLMSHAGDIMLVAYLCNAKVVKILGDSKQIPFISRLSGFVPKHHIMPLSRENIIKATTTYRCPKSMMPILLQFYDEIITASKIEGDYKCVKITSEKEIYGKYDLAMTFTQDEKEVVNRLMETDSVHEAQGSSVNNVALIRLNPQQVPIYTSQPHILVALTRHKVSFTYFTVDTNDAVSKALNMIYEPDEIEYEETEFHLDARIIGQVRCPILQRQIKLDTYTDYYSNKWSFLNYITQFMRWYSTASVLETRIVYKNHPVIDTNDEQDIPIQVVQQSFNQIFEYIDKYKRMEIYNEDIYPLPYNLKVIWTKYMKFKLSSAVYLTPVLITHQPTVKPKLVERLAAIKKRNLDPPRLAKLTDPLIVERIVLNFINTYIDKDKLDAVLKTHETRSLTDLVTWVKGRTSQQLKKMEGMMRKPANARQYDMHLKTSGKASLKNDHNVTIAGGQTITAQHPLITAQFSVFRAFERLLRQSLKPNYLMAAGMTKEEINGFINFHLMNHHAVKILESDASKFDKSLEEIVLEAQVILMYVFKVSLSEVKEYRNAHETNTLKDHALGIIIKTVYQTRSGEFLTWLRNTLAKMMSDAYAYPLDRAILAIFTGDDDIMMFKPDEVLYDNSKLITEVFNIINKVEIFPEAPYFASKFLIKVEGQFLLIPDPIKTMVRLGRDDLYCKEHVIEYWKSFKDNYSDYLNNKVRLELARSVQIRFENRLKSLGSVRFVIQFIASIVRSKEKFLTLFTGPNYIWKRKMLQSQSDEILRASRLYYDDWIDV